MPGLGVEWRDGDSLVIKSTCDWFCSNRCWRLLTKIPQPWTAR